MPPTAPASLRDRLRTQLADLKMPGALEALDDILRQVDGGQLAAGEAIHAVLHSQIRLRNQRRLQTAMRSARLNPCFSGYRSSKQAGTKPSKPRANGPAQAGKGIGAGTFQRHRPAGLDAANDRIAQNCGGTSHAPRRLPHSIGGNTMLTAAVLWWLGVPLIVVVLIFFIFLRRR